MADLEKLLNRYGPMTTSRATQLLVKRGLSPEAARQRVSRRPPTVETLRGLTFPKRARFIFLTEEFGSDKYWDALLRAIDETNPAYAAALAALRARGGVSLSKHFDIVSGSPVLQKRQLASKVVLRNLETARLVQIHDIEGIGSCIVLGRSSEGLTYKARRLRALLMTEAVLLDAIRSWAGRMNLASPNTTSIRDEPSEPMFGTFRFDMTGPSYLLPLVTHSSSKLTHGFLVADVLLDVDLSPAMVSAFLRKCTMLSQLPKVRPFIPMLIADSFSPDALRLCRGRGIIATRADTLFGDDVARALKDLLHTLRNTSTGTPERLDKLFDKLSAIEGAAGNLRGALFELVVSHCVQQLEGGEISLGQVLLDIRDGKRAEVDVLREKQLEVTAYECKGYRSPIELEHVTHWLTEKVPTIYAALKNQGRFSNSRFAFEFWTASTFSDEAEAFLKKSKATIRRYRVDWKNGKDIRTYAEGLSSSGLRKIFDEHYFKEVVNRTIPAKPMEAVQSEAVSI